MQVAEVAGVRRVESLMHLEGTTPPHIADAEQASAEAAQRAGGGGTAFE